jgi:hypothetical protein
VADTARAIDPFRPWLPVRRPKLRESRYSELPNFRNHAKQVDNWLLDTAASLQRKHGEAWASEAGWRKMIGEDSGHMAGPSTVPKAVRRLAKHGLVLYRNLRKGDVMPDGSLCRKGTMLVYVPQNRHEKRALRTLAEHRAERDPYRVVPHAAKSFKDTKKKIATVYELPREESMDRKVSEARRLIAQAVAVDPSLWLGKPPPD